MTDPDAYGDEMTNPFGPTDDQLDGVFAGVASVDELEEVAAFLLETKTACTEAPPEEVSTRHMAAILEQARQATGTRPLIQKEVVVAERTMWRRAMERTMSTVLKGAAGVLAASVSMIGLAYAGVNLPGEAAANAIEAVTGVELPNQGDEGKSVADDVKAVVESDAEKGCEFGQAVAAAASQNAQGDRPDEDRCAEDGADSDEARGSRATGAEKSAAGRAKAAEKSAAGQATATEKSGGASDSGADTASGGAENASTGKATAEEKSSGSGAGGSDAGGSDHSDGASDGLGTASEMSGGASGSAGANTDRRP